MPLFASKKSSPGSSADGAGSEAGGASAAPPQVPAAPAASGVKGRRRPTLIALGVALIAVCSLGAWWVVEQTSEATPVVVAKKDIAAGTVIDEGDLTTIEAQLPAGAKVIPGDDLSGLVGQHATSAIEKGSLVSPGQVTDQPIPAEGTVVVGIRAMPGQMPAANVDPGDHIAIVATPRESEDPPQEAPIPTNGIVQSVSESYPDGSRVVDVVVSKEDAPSLAALAATGRISIVLTAGRL